jgi:hypothetical protein
MTIITKVIDGTRIKLGVFENGNDAFDLMMKDFLKEAGVENIPEHIDEDFVGVELKNLEVLINDYELYTEYGYGDGEGNTLFLSKGLSNYYWYLSVETENINA